jgi:hypothetical protein
MSIYHQQHQKNKIGRKHILKHVFCRPRFIFLSHSTNIQQIYIDIYVVQTDVAFLVVANYAESRLSQGNLNQPDVAFCFMSAAIS